MNKNGQIITIALTPVLAIAKTVAKHSRYDALQKKNELKML